MYRRHIQATSDSKDLLFESCSIRSAICNNRSSLEKIDQRDLDYQRLLHFEDELRTEQ